MNGPKYFGFVLCPFCTMEWSKKMSPRRKGPLLKRPFFNVLLWNGWDKNRTAMNHPNTERVWYSSPHFTLYKNKKFERKISHGDYCKTLVKTVQ